MDASPLPVRPMLLQRGDVRLVALDFGGEGPAALLLHGLAGYAGEWVVTARWLTAAAAHIVDAAPGRRATSNCIIEGWVVAAVAALAPPIRAAALRSRAARCHVERDLSGLWPYAPQTRQASGRRAGRRQGRPPRSGRRGRRPRRSLTVRQRSPGGGAPRGRTRRSPRTGRRPR